MGVVEVGVIAVQVQLHVEQIAGDRLERFACCAQIHLHIVEHLEHLEQSTVSSHKVTPISDDAAANLRQYQSMI